MGDGKGRGKGDAAGNSGDATGRTPAAVTCRCSSRSVANAVAAADSSAVRLAKCRYGAAPLTPALRAASATERPATPFAEIRSTAAAMSA
jgi:hypothetical protein